MTKKRPPGISYYPDDERKALINKFANADARNINKAIDRLMDFAFEHPEVMKKLEN